MKASPNAAGLQTCPVEIIVKIFLKIGKASSMLALRSVNRFLAEIFDGSDILKYQVKLLAWGYESVEDLSQDSRSTGTGGMSTGDRIENLDRVMKNFASLDWKESAFKTSDSFCDYHLSHGLLSFTLNPTLKEFRVVELPSRTRGTGLVVRTKARLPFRIGEMSMDPTQDLVVFVEMYVSIVLSLARSQKIHLLSFLEILFLALFTLAGICMLRMYRRRWLSISIAYRRHWNNIHLPKIQSSRRS